MDRPLPVKVRDHVVQFVLLQEVDQFEAANFTVVGDPFVLPSCATSKLVCAGKEQDEAHWQEGHYEEENYQKDKEKPRHRRVGPEH